MKASLTLLVVLATSCGGGAVDNTGPGDWNDAVTGYVAAVCQDLATCTGDDPDACESDVRTDLADARAALDDADEAACIECLNVKAEQAHDESFTCDPADIDMDAIIAACGPNGDDACAGFP
jgi:hypothetical protein